jgi:hypothetical protein
MFLVSGNDQLSQIVGSYRKKTLLRAQVNRCHAEIVRIRVRWLISVVWQTEYIGRINS